MSGPAILGLALAGWLAVSLLCAIFYVIGGGIAARSCEERVKRITDAHAELLDAVIAAHELLKRAELVAPSAIPRAEAIIGGALIRAEDAWQTIVEEG